MKPVVSKSKTEIKQIEILLGGDGGFKYSMTLMLLGPSQQTIKSFPTPNFWLSANRARDTVFDFIGAVILLLEEQLRCANGI